MRKLASSRVHRIYLPIYAKGNYPSSYVVVDNVQWTGIWGYRPARKHARQKAVELQKAGNYTEAQRWRNAMHRWD